MDHLISLNVFKTEEDKWCWEAEWWEPGKHCGFHSFTSANEYQNYAEAYADALLWLENNI